MRLDEVLHKPILPSKVPRWHVLLQGHPEELLDALAVLAKHEHDSIQSAELVAGDQLLICLNWVDDVMPRFAAADIAGVSNFINIKFNGKEQCHGHNLCT